MNYWIDYAQKGSGNIGGKFVALSPLRNSADHYFEVGVNASAGTLYPLSSSGNIQYRIAKSDWSNFNEANDYSYTVKDVMKNNNKITVYYKGALIYGTEPAIIAGSSIVPTTTKVTDLAMSNAAGLTETSSQKVVLYPNPVTGDHFFIALTSDLLNKPITVRILNLNGIVLQSNVVEQNNGTMQVSLNKAYPAGLYFVQLNNMPVLKLMINR